MIRNSLYLKGEIFENSFYDLANWLSERWNVKDLYLCNYEMAWDLLSPFCRIFYDLGRSFSLHITPILNKEKEKEKEKEEEKEKKMITLSRSKRNPQNFSFDKLSENEIYLANSEGKLDLKERLWVPDLFFCDRMSENSIPVVKIAGFLYTLEIPHNLFFYPGDKVRESIWKNKEKHKEEEKKYIEIKNSFPFSHRAWKVSELKNGESGYLIPKFPILTKKNGGGETRLIESDGKSKMILGGFFVSSSDFLVKIKTIHRFYEDKIQLTRKDDSSFSVLMNKYFYSTNYNPSDDNFRVHLRESSLSSSSEFLVRITEIVLQEIDLI